MWARSNGRFSGSVQLHRSMLIGGTIGVAVGASRVAALPHEAPSWVLLGGSALLVIVADLAREIEESASALARSSGADRKEARRDIYNTRRPALYVVLLVGALGLIGVSLALFATGVGKDAAAKSRGAAGAGTSHASPIGVGADVGAAGVRNGQFLPV